MVKSIKRNNAGRASPANKLTARLVMLKNCFAFDFYGIHQTPETSIWGESIKIKFILDNNLYELDKCRVPEKK